MKITHTANHMKDDNPLSNVEFHKIVQDVGTPPRSDSPLIFSATETRHFNPLYHQVSRI